MEEHLSPSFTAFGLVFDVSTILMTLVASVIVFLIIFFATRNLTSRTPKGMQNFLEWVIEFVRGIAKQSMDAGTAERFVTLGLTLFLYVFIANQLGLLFNVVTVQTAPNESIGVTAELLQHAKSAGQEGVSVSWWKSPTATVSIPFALAIMVLLYTHWLGLRQGAGKYVKSYFQPHWALLPLNIIEELSKFLSFPLRLFGNIFAGEVLIWVLVPSIQAGGISYILSLPLIAWLGYSIFVGSIQAFIFTMLTMVYIAHRVHTHEAH
ncbi:F0F1 ATP synthase subunit A [Ferviditalea candida]|uniref:ATP synthase subunit a n=1 Tax=Ferviditalea candida TaxID=3108399 RepID=A0ABU5ZJ33_9BACL|nr:F0F1 ATP synthase subunit A [Paenibacillaceae bacterium T2]